jgi:NRAMP (natural resistance-associated macrophage protein)-like metal ion transporter
VITGAADDDPSGIATYSVAGAQLGTSLLWTALLTWPLMAAVQIMCARIGKVTGQGLSANFKQRFPGWLLRVFIVALLVANTINIAADLAGMADAASMLSGINAHLFVVTFAVLISWATIRLQYRQIADVLKWLVLVLFAYPITAFVVGADWSSVLRATLVPSVPHSRDAWSMLVAILGTTISPYLFFWQASEEVEEEKAAGQATLAQRRGASIRELELRNIDVGVGTFFSNLVMFFIILTTAITLHSRGGRGPSPSRRKVRCHSVHGGHRRRRISCHPNAGGIHRLRFCGNTRLATGLEQGVETSPLVLCRDTALDRSRRCAGLRWH